MTLRNWSGLSIDSASLFTKQQENETTTQNIREEDPNEYEFEITLLDTLQVLQENDDRIVVLENGRVRDEGTWDDLVRRGALDADGVR